MKILLQRVSSAEVAVAGERIARIERGVLLLVGFGRENAAAGPELTRTAEKIVNLRIFANAQSKLDQSLLAIGGAVLAVPQFTLYGQARKGRRPEFTDALAPALAESHFQAFVEALRRTPVTQVESGRFGADMQVSLVNDGPFTLLLDG